MKKQNDELLEFERVTYDYITELKDIPTTIRMIDRSGHKKANILISCVKNLIRYVQKEMSKVERDVKK